MAETPQQNGHGNWLWGTLFTLLALAVIYFGCRLLRYNAGFLVSDFFHPYVELARTLNERVAQQSLLAFSRRELADKLATLQLRNSELEIRTKEMKRLAAENRELRRNAGLAAHAPWHCVTAEILLRDPLRHRESFTINCGRDRGLYPGAAVIAVNPEQQAVLIGVIDRVGRHDSVVSTVFNRSLRLSGRLESGGAVGFINAGSRYRSAGLLPIDSLPLSLTLQGRSRIVTTGFEHLIPADLLIGTLVNLDQLDPLYTNELHRSGEMKPAAEIDTLHFVVVVLRENTGR